MSFRYYPKKTTNAVTKRVTYVPFAADTPSVGVDYVASRIEKESTVSAADIRAVLNALESVIISELKEGRSVRLGDLGSFRLTLSGAGADTPEGCTDANIRDVRVRFSQGAAMRRELTKQNMSFERLEAPVSELRKKAAAGGETTGSEEESGTGGGGGLDPEE